MGGQTVFAKSTVINKSGATKRDRTLARKIAGNAEKAAKSMNSKGLCYRGVKRAVGPLGIKLTGNAAYKAKKQLLVNRKFRLVAKTTKGTKLRRGDILVHHYSPTKPWGHIAVYLGDGLEASDHIRKVVRGIGYGGTSVFRPVIEQSITKAG